MSQNNYQNIHFESYGPDIATDKGVPFFWGHGWGQSHRAFELLAHSLSYAGQHWLLDFHGFGQTPPPPENWGTDDYADVIADFIRSKTDQPIYWIGHSFGCRVGIQLAARHPELIKGMIFIAGAGLKRKRPLWQTLYFKVRIAVFKTLKKIIPEGAPRERLYRLFGSRDYKSAGVMRDIFVKVVNENLVKEAKAIQCPVQLIYGADDTETPPEIGERLSQLIPNSNLIVMDGYDHYTILTSAQHQVAKRIYEFVKTTRAQSA